MSFVLCPKALNPTVCLSLPLSLSFSLCLCLAVVATSCNWHSARWPKWKCYVLSFHVPASTATSRISQASPETLRTLHWPSRNHEPRTGMGTESGRGKRNCELKRKLAQMKLIYSMRLLNFSWFFVSFSTYPTPSLLLLLLKGAPAQRGLSTRFSNQAMRPLGRSRENRLPRNIELLSAPIWLRCVMHIQRHINIPWYNP